MIYAFYFISTLLDNMRNHLTISLKKHKTACPLTPFYCSKFFIVVRHLTLLLFSPMSFCLYSLENLHQQPPCNKATLVSEICAFSSLSPESLIITSYQPKRNFTLMSLINHHNLIQLRILEMYFLQFSQCIILSSRHSHYAVETTSVLEAPTDISMK